MSWSSWIAATALLSFVPVGILAADGEPSPAQPSNGKTAPPDVHDRRADPPKDKEGPYPFTPAKSKAEWDVRAEQLHRQLLVATGLWPMPERTPPHAVVHGRVVREGYTVERVYFESYPGFYVTGSLYRPLAGVPAGTGKAGRRPGVLCPHGHFVGGRFQTTDARHLKEALESGGEKFEIGGAHFMQARCVQLARMGCVVFHYDMIGYADSVQIPESVAHKLMQRRLEMETPEGWGLLTPQADLHLQSIVGLQTYNSIRALDWLRELPDVDPDRIACTGASGGGTQTYLLAAIDPRVAVAFPAVMVSSGRQGGCTCEHCSLLRIGTGNVEISALIAPRPLGMTFADDWTREMPTKGMPELKEHYAMLGVPDRVEGFPFLQFEHNYNAVSRQAMYGFLNKHLQLGLKEPIVEHDYLPLTTEEMTVWDDKHPRPTGGVEYERSLTKEIAAINDRQMAALRPHDEKSLAEYRRVVGGAWEVMLGGAMPAARDLSGTNSGGFEAGLLHVTLPSRGQTTNAEWIQNYSPQHRERVANGQLIVWISSAGKHGLQSNDTVGATALRPAVKKLFDAGFPLFAPNLFAQGASPDITQNRRVKADRDYAGYTYCYNLPLFAERVQDLLAIVAYLKTQKGVKQIYLVGLDETGPLVAAARAQAGAAVARAVINTRGFRFGDVKEFDDAKFVPGAAKYGDLPSLFALGAPNETYVLGEGNTLPEIVRAAYKAVGKPDNAIAVGGSGAAAEADAMKWLMRP